MPTRRSAAPADWLQLDRQLCFALYSASLAMTKAYKPLLAPLGLTYPQYLVMLVLWEQARAAATPALMVNELGERLSLDSGTLTPLLKRLEQQGLVQRLRDVADERRVRLQLTAAGRALRARALKIPPAIAASAGCGLDEIAAMTRRLTELRQQIQSSPPRAA